MIPIFLEKILKPKKEYFTKNVLHQKNNNNNNNNDNKISGI